MAFYRGYYLTGNRATRNQDGYIYLDYWIKIVDDVINVSGPCLSTAEIDSPLILYRKVAGYYSLRRHIRQIGSQIELLEDTVI